MSGREADRLKSARPASFGQHALPLLAGVVTLAVLRSIPVVGNLIVRVSTTIGLGAIALSAYRGIDRWWQGLHRPDVHTRKTAHQPAVLLRTCKDQSVSAAARAVP
jgi:hypothetical protein